MPNILLVEPDYRSKFPPLGLLRIGSYHKDRGDSVTFVRGRDATLQALKWHKVYVSSLFTYELPRTVKTLKFYRDSVEASDDLIVGGIGATLMSSYIQERVACTVMEGPLSRPRMIAHERKPIAKYDPDYSVIDDPRWGYSPKNAYFCRVTTGCIRKCKFCAVPHLEPEFAYCRPIRQQVLSVNKRYGERRDLVLLDNNILACESVEDIISGIRDLGFGSGAIYGGRQRIVDFNQGIDARLITARLAKSLSGICLSPVRLAFDYSAMEKQYTRAIKHMANAGFREYTNYVMYNFNDDAGDFYHRIRTNAMLSAELGVRITSFPMRFRPIYSTMRGYVSEKWPWRYLRGIQCVLLATHGLVSPNIKFFNAAFGETLEQFYEILSMPDRYIIYRKKYATNGARDWRLLYRRLSPSRRAEFLDALAVINRSRDKPRTIANYKRFSRLIEHYYPGGKSTPCE